MRLLFWQAHFHFMRYVGKDTYAAHKATIVEGKLEYWGEESMVEGY